MLRKFIVWIVLFFVFNCRLFAQEAGITEKYKLSGIIVSLDKAVPLEYVFVWLPGRRIVTHSGKDGFFTLFIPSNYMHDTLCFSLLSYQTLRVAIPDFDKKMDTIFMAEKFIYLEQVKVKGNWPLKSKSRLTR